MSGEQNKENKKKQTLFSFVFPVFFCFGKTRSVF